MDERVQNNERPETESIDINQPGMLVHGLDSSDPEILEQVLKEGLKTRNDQDNPREGFNVVPDYVSMSMVGERGYAGTSTAFSFGANEREFNSSLSVVIDPEYVKQHATDFRAVGEFFGDEVMSKIFTNSNGEIFNGIKYKPFTDSRNDDVFHDEVLAKSLPPEAIIGIVTRRKHAQTTQENLEKMNLGREIQLFDVEGKKI